MISAADLTEDTIADLRTEAGSAGDATMVALCVLAEFGVSGLYADQRELLESEEYALTSIAARMVIAEYLGEVLAQIEDDETEAA